MFLYGFIMAVVLIVLINIIVSKALYRDTKEIEIANGNINYSSADLDILAVNIKNEGSDKYTTTDTIPTSGYVLSSDSYCTVPNQKEQIKDIQYSHGKLIVSLNKKGTKCYLYFEELSSESTLKRLFPGYTTATSGTNLTVDPATGVVKVSGVDTENHPKTLYQAEDNDGTSYFFRGQASDNWVQFANMN